MLAPTSLSRVATDYNIIFLITHDWKIGIVNILAVLVKWAGQWEEHQPQAVQHRPPACRADCILQRGTGCSTFRAGQSAAVLQAPAGETAPSPATSPLHAQPAPQHRQCSVCNSRSQTDCYSTRQQNWFNSFQPFYDVCCCLRYPDFATIVNLSVQCHTIPEWGPTQKPNPNESNINIGGK